MAVRKVEVERFSLTTSRPFESVIFRLKFSIGTVWISLGSEAIPSRPGTSPS